jgi:orotate phosphoribosyltransferase
MPLDVLTLLSKTGALLQGHFRLSSGLHSPNYVQCALLLEYPRHAKAIGEELAAKVRSIRAQKVVAPAMGGVIIGYTVAEALDLPSIFTERKEGQMTLRRGFKINRGERVLIVEDVVTTGKSTREAAKVVADHGGLVFGFASILNRSGKPNPFDAPYESLLKLDLETHEASDCPLCLAGVSLSTPGSRFV